jgi:hypothetical protein
MTGPSRARDGDRGTTLVDVVIGLALTTIAGWLVANLLTSTAERTAPPADEYDIGLAADVFIRDVRDSDRVEIAIGRGPITAIDLRRADGIVRWEIAGPVLTRRTPTEAIPRTMASDLTVGSSFSLRDGEGSAIDPSRADDVQSCTRLVVMDLSRETSSDEESRDVQRSAALRVPPRSEACR